MKRLVLVGALVSLPLVAHAQPPRLLQWEMPQTTQGQAQTYTYWWILDGGAEATITASCTGDNPAVCRTPLPGLAPNVAHTVVLWAVHSSGADGARTAPFLVWIPVMPEQLRMVAMRW